MTLRLLNGTLIDGTGAAPRPFESITIRDGTIAAIDEAGRDPALADGAATSIDLAGAHLLPGLWDAHAHLGFMLPQTDLSRTPAHERPSDRTVRAGHAAMQALDHGVTALRIVGEADYVDVAWKRAFAEGMYVGPRMFVCGYALSATGGHGWQTGVSVQVDGVAEVRKAAREQMRQGADQVKLLVTGGVSSATETMHEPQMTFDEIAAAVEVAHFKGRKVCAHIGGSLGAKMSIEAGVDCLEHGYDLDDEVIDMMVERGTYLVPTLAVTQDEAFVLEHNAPYAIEKIMKAAPRHLDSFQRALKAGVKIATGEDMPVPFAERVVPEIETMVRAGMRPMDAIVASTRTAAELCGVLDTVGTVETGKLADLIVVDGDPSADIARLHHVTMVFKEGRVVVNRRATSERVRR